MKTIVHYQTTKHYGDIRIQTQVRGIVARPYNYGPSGWITYKSYQRKRVVVFEDGSKKTEYDFIRGVRQDYK